MATQQWKGAADDYRLTLQRPDAYLAAWRASMMTVRELPSADQLDAMGIEAIASIRINRATALVNMGELDEAMAEIDAGIDEAPLLSRAISALLTLRGRMHADARRYGVARKDFEQALRNTPDDLEARFMMATTLVVEGTEEPTTTISRTTVGVTQSGTIGASVPIASDTTSSRGPGFDRAKLEEALIMYDDLIAADPTFGSAFYQRGFVRMVLSLPGYCDDYKKAIELGEPLALSGKVPEECRE
jgi:tetratricopeptide (TPR) repeat protein